MCIVRSYYASCVRLIKLTNETNDTRNERYTKRTSQLHKRSANERKTKNGRTIHANETNEERKRYEISVNLNDPGSVCLFLRFCYWNLELFRQCGTFLFFTSILISVYILHTVVSVFTSNVLYDGFDR